MNQEQKLYLRITQNGELSEQIEVLDFRGALKAIYDSFVEHNARKVMMNVEISNHPFTSNSLLNREQELEQSILSQAIEDPDTIIYQPDVTLRECQEAWASPEGQAMFKYQRAESRMGIDPDLLADLKKKYESKFPRVAPHGPKWTSS